MEVNIFYGKLMVEIEVTACYGKPMVAMESHWLLQKNYYLI
jgi:hypothetical protein